MGSSHKINSIHSPKNGKSSKTTKNQEVNSKFVTSTKNSSKKEVIKSFNQQPKGDRQISIGVDKRVLSKNFSPVRSIANKMIIKEDKLKNPPIDMFCYFMCSYDDMREKVETTLNAVGIKFILTTNSDSIFKCEKIGIKFTISINANFNGYFVKSIKTQGAVSTYKDLIIKFYKKLNEV